MNLINSNYKIGRLIQVLPTWKPTQVMNENECHGLRVLMRLTIKEIKVLNDFTMEYKEIEINTIKVWNSKETLLYMMLIDSISKSRGILWCKSLMSEIWSTNLMNGKAGILNMMIRTKFTKNTTDNERYQELPYSLVFENFNLKLPRRLLKVPCFPQLKSCP